MGEEWNLAGHRQGVPGAQAEPCGGQPPFPGAPTGSKHSGGFKEQM